MVKLMRRKELRMETISECPNCYATDPSLYGQTKFVREGYCTLCNNTGVVTLKVRNRWIREFINRAEFTVWLRNASTNMAQLNDETKGTEDGKQR